jgi:hypothetical protein
MRPKSGFDCIRCLRPKRRNIAALWNSTLSKITAATAAATHRRQDLLQQRAHVGRRFRRSSRCGGRSSRKNYAPRLYRAADKGNRIRGTLGKFLRK